MTLSFYICTGIQWMVNWHKNRSRLDFKDPLQWLIKHLEGICRRMTDFPPFLLKKPTTTPQHSLKMALLWCSGALLVTLLSPPLCPADDLHCQAPAYKIAHLINHAKMFDDNTETKEEERWQAATAVPQNMATFELKGICLSPALRSSLLVSMLSKLVEGARLFGPAPNLGPRGRHSASVLKLSIHLCHIKCTFLPEAEDGVAQSRAYTHIRASEDAPRPMGDFSVSSKTDRSYSYISN